MTVSTGAGIEAALRAALPDAAPTRISGIQVDGLTPAFAVSPRTQSDVANALKAANETGAAVIPYGRGEFLNLGNAPSRYHISLGLENLNQILELEPADLTVTVEAGVGLAALQQRLAENGQWLPLDPPNPTLRTIGGILATNASGPARMAFGTARDLVIGMTVATASGDIVKSGGRVVKNVAGYDMAKIHIGALGTLGVILQASFKVAPLPAQTVSLATDPVAPEKAIQLVHEILKRGMSVTGLAISGSGGHLSTHVRFAGSAAAVERSWRECQMLAAEAGCAFREKDAEDSNSFASAYVSTNSTTALVVRLVGPIEQMADLAATLMRHEGRIGGYPTAGVLYAAFGEASDALAQEIRDLRVRLGASGAVVIESAPPAFKKSVDIWGPPRADFELMRRLKAEMDPNHILNPGRFIGGL